MVHKYDPAHGVPAGHYYLTEIVQFADFEIDQIEKIIFTSENENELIHLCRSKGWLMPPTEWATHYIKKVY